MYDKAIFIGSDVYLKPESSDDLYESYIKCADCDGDVGCWQYDTQDSTVEMFIPYWLCDEDNSVYLCGGCWNSEQTRAYAAIMADAPPIDQDRF